MKHYRASVGLGLAVGCCLLGLCELGSANAAQVALQIFCDQYVQIVAQVKAQNGDPVADGTPVIWVSSLGSLSLDGLSRRPVVMSSTVQGGYVSALLFTTPVNGQGMALPQFERGGTARVVMLSGKAARSVEIEFYDPCAQAAAPLMAPLWPLEAGAAGTGTPLRIQLDQRVLAGEEEANGQEEACWEMV